MKASSILLIQPTVSSFIGVDYHILSSIAPTKAFILAQHKSRLRYLARMLLMPAVILTLSRSTLVCIWFADYHAAIAVLLCRIRRIKSIIFIGGYDAVCYPELGMGVYCKKPRGIAATYALRHCSLIIANHEALIESRNYYYNHQGHKDGIRHYVPNLHTPSRVVFNGLSTDYCPILTKKRTNTIISAGTTPRMQDFINKGFDLLIEAAKKREDYEFVIIGVKPEWKQTLDSRYHYSQTKNLRVCSYLPQSEIFNLMETAKVYVQASISEGMPNSLMEAMLCGCIPVGSNVAGIPILIGDCGYILESRSVEELLKALDLAINSDIDPQTISNRVREQFSVAQRLMGIRQAIDEL